MSAFDASNTEAWVCYLGATREEFASLQEFVASYRLHTRDSRVPLVIVDQSEAVRREMRELGSQHGPVLLPIHERHCVEIAEPDLSLEEIRETLEKLTTDPVVRVHRPERRYFHSQCINAIVHHWSRAPFVLLFDSDSVVCRGGLLPALSQAYPLEQWDSITAAGSVVDFVDATRRVSLKRRARSLLGTQREVERKLARRWRLPRLHPHCLMLNRELILAHQIDFRLLFLDVLEQGWKDDPLRAGRIMGDTGASLLAQSAYHGLRIGDFAMSDFVQHRGRISYRPTGNRGFLSLDWW